MKNQPLFSKEVSFLSLKSGSSEYDVQGLNRDVSQRLQQSVSTESHELFSFYDSFLVQKTCDTLLWTRMHVVFLASVTPGKQIILGILGKFVFTGLVIG